MCCSEGWCQWCVACVAGLPQCVVRRVDVSGALRVLQDYHSVLFGGSVLGASGDGDQCGMELCLPVSVEELVQTNKQHMVSVGPSV